MLPNARSPRSPQERRPLLVGASGLALAALAALVFIVVGILSPDTGLAESDKTPRELGAVAWERDFEKASARARQESKPIFLLFQEIPGCQTCVSFGSEVLSHPLLVESIESDFVPLAIYNNRGGADREILERFKEPTWNNPVVRFVDASGKDLIARRDRVWRPNEIAERMTQALEAAKRPTPDYLAALAQELGPQGIEKATLTMGCYWSGEACLGGLPGLLSSRAGDLAGREVVELRFDSARTSYADILHQAKQRGCADSVLAHGDDQLRVAQTIFPGASSPAPGFARDARARDQKYHLKRYKSFKSVELTPAQSVQLNHALWAKKSWRHILSPRQAEQIR